jgi:hypothetical protein
MKRFQVKFVVTAMEKRISAGKIKQLFQKIIKRKNLRPILFLRII